MAATKEALVIVLDVGPGMNQAPPGHPTDLQTSLTAINMILQRKLFAESKDEIALVLFGTPDTNNDLADGETYENVTVARPLGMVNWDLMQYLQNDVQPSTVSGDFLDAMVVAMDHLMKNIQGKRGFGSKRLILFSNLCGEFGDDQLDDILGSIKEAELELNVIGPNLDDDDEDEDDEARQGPSNGHVKEKSPQQRAGETLLKHMIDSVDGESYSFSEALPALSFFQSRQVRSAAWKCPLRIGTDLEIPVCMYARIKEAKAKSFKNVYAKDDEAGLERLRTYHLNDEEETEIEHSDVVDGHRYGSTLVPFSEDDKEALKYKSEKCFSVLGFTKSENVKRWQFLGDGSSVCIAEKGDVPASVALSSLINAMYETNTVAIVRYVYRANTKVKLGCLAPHIKTNHECLLYNELPFAEDVRGYTFGSLPVKPENTAANKKFEPSDAQLSVMDELMNSMDLSNIKDNDAEPEEALKPKLTFNPYLQRLYQCLEHRALNPDDPLPELSPVVASYLKPPPAVEAQCQVVVDKMKTKYKLEVVAKKKDAETADNIFKDQDAAEPPPSKKQKVDDDLKGGMADLVKAKVTEVGTVNPVQDFKAIINQKDQDQFEEACKMMQKRIIQLVMDSFGVQFYDKALDCLKALRAETVQNDEPKIFNDFLTDFKESLKAKSRKDFWEDILKAKVGLISKMECEDGGVSKAEAEAFLKEEKEPSQPQAEPDADADDLLDEME